MGELEINFVFLFYIREIIGIFIKNWGKLEEFLIISKFLCNLIYYYLGGL